MSRVVTWVCAMLCGSAMSAYTQNASAPVRAASPPASAAGQGSAAAAPLQRHVTLDLHDVSLLAALREIDRQAALHLNYSERTIPADRRVTIVVRDVPAREALARILRGTGV
jgi:hypothetical protein